MPLRLGCVSYQTGATARRHAGAHALAGCTVYGLGFRVQGSVFTVRGFRPLGPRLSRWGLRFRGCGLGFRVRDL